MYELTISGSFASAHFLKGYNGPCEQLHGHTWKVEITIVADALNDIGVVVDFKVLKGWMNSLLEQLDHACLNDLPAFQEQNPTTENLARFLYHTFAERCQPHRVKQVRIWESDSSAVTYYE